MARLKTSNHFSARSSSAGRSRPEPSAVVGGAASSASGTNSKPMQPKPNAWLRCRTTTSVPASGAPSGVVTRTRVVPTRWEKAGSGWGDDAANLMATSYGNRFLDGSAPAGSFVSVPAGRLSP